MILSVGAFLCCGMKKGKKKKKNLFRSISIVAKKHGSTTIMALLFIYLFFPPLSGKAL